MVKIHHVTTIQVEENKPQKLHNIVVTHQAINHKSKNTMKEKNQHVRFYHRENPKFPFSSQLNNYQYLRTTNVNLLMDL